MASYSWLGGSGDWANAAEWSPAGGPPTSTDSAAISATGAAYVVTVNSADAAGSLTVSGSSATFEAEGASGSLTVAGALDLSAGTIDVATASINSGAMSVGGEFDFSGGALNVYAGGEVTLGGTLDQTGGVLSLDGGTIEGGTLEAGGQTHNHWDRGTLSDLTYEGWFYLSDTNAKVHFADGAKVVAGNGRGPGLITINGHNATLDFDNSQTVVNDTINLGNHNSTDDTLALDDTQGVGNQTLTIASSVTINTIGDDRYSIIDASLGANDTIVNLGVINNLVGGLKVKGTSFDNFGTINIKQGDVFTQATTFTNQGTINLLGGTDLYILGSFINKNDIDLSGYAADIIVENSISGFLNEGTIELTAAGLHNSGQQVFTNASGSSVVGYGSVSMPIVNSGVITASGGLLDIEGPVSGNGSDLVSGAATLRFSDDVGSGQSVSFTGEGGTLQLIEPDTFQANIYDFDMGGATKDRLKLGDIRDPTWNYVGFAENAAHTQGTMTFSNGVTMTTLTLVGDYIAANFVHSTDVYHDTFVTYT